MSDSATVERVGTLKGEAAASRERVLASKLLSADAGWRSNAPPAILSTLFLFALTMATGFAQLKWDTLEQNVTARANAESIEARFHFTNAGNFPVTILEIQPSCGCTTVELAKKLYAPGEAGDLVAHFDIRGRTGFQEKSIVVLTKDTINDPVVLRLVVDLPPSLTVEPEYLLWHSGEPMTSKSIHVSVAPETTLEIASIKASTSDLQMDLKQIVPGKELEIILKPKTTNPVKATLTIQAGDSLGKQITRYAWAQIK